MNLNRQEVDELRVLSRLPVGSELYMFKLNQFKVFFIKLILYVLQELSSQKADIEKEILE